MPAAGFAEGARLASILVNLGVDDEQFRDFVSKLYTKCQKNRVPARTSWVSSGSAF